jgi:hypothetical protein
MSGSRDAYEGAQELERQWMKDRRGGESPREWLDRKKREKEEGKNGRV